MDIKKKKIVYSGKPRKDFFGSRVEEGYECFKYHLNNPNGMNSTIIVSRHKDAKPGSKDFNKLNNLKR